MSAIELKLPEILSTMQSVGWAVDHTEYKASIECSDTQPGSRVLLCVWFLPEEEVICFNYAVLLESEVGMVGECFLEEVIERIPDEQLGVFLEEPNRVDLQWSIESEHFTPESTDTELLLEQIRQIVLNTISLPVSCAQILMLCSEQETGPLPEDKRTPERLAELCLCGYLRSSEQPSHDA